MLREAVSIRYARGRIDGRCARLDERYLALRQQAYALSHRVLAASLIAATAATEIYLTSGNTLQLDANTFWPAAISTESQSTVIFELRSYCGANRCSASKTDVQVTSSMPRTFSHS